MMLWAVHISDGVLQTPWIVAGFALAGLLLLAGLWRIRDDEVPRIALLTAAFFVVSLMHVRVGPTSVHLLFNSLIGVLLGWRAALAIVCGLFLQFLYLAHGGILALGVNACVLTLPALAAWLLFTGLHRLPILRRSWCQALLVIVTTFAWTLSLVFSVTLLQANSLGALEELAIEPAWQRTLHPVTLALALAAALMAAMLERRLENAPEFSLGLLIGALTVMASVGLNCAVLVLGGERVDGALPGRWVPLALLVAHLPIAVFEGIVLGFTLGFLAKVKPEMLGRLRPGATEETGAGALDGGAKPPAAAVSSPAWETPRPAPPPTVPARD
jgi:ABC-type Co2+ transport system permease subunit